MPLILIDFTKEKEAGYQRVFKRSPIISSAKELATSVQMSPHYFSRLFKETTGVTPHQYVVRCRIDRAKVLLKQRKLSIAEIAKEVGFVDQSHLHRYFKRLVGVTPKKYSQEFQKG